MPPLKCVKPAAASEAVNGLRDSEFAGERLDPKHIENTLRVQASTTALAAALLKALARRDGSP
jgi:hypothetical protein